MNSGSGRKGPLMPLHFLCTQRLQPPQKIALELPTPDWQTPQGYFPDFFSTSRLMPDSIIFVFPMFTCRPFFSISVLHVCTFTSSSSMDSALIIRSSAYSSSHGQPVRNSLDRASSTMMKSSGLRTEPWWTPTPKPNSSLYPSPTLTLLPCTWTGPDAPATRQFLVCALPTRWHPVELDQMLSPGRRRPCRAACWQPSASPVADVQ